MKANVFRLIHPAGWPITLAVAAVFGLLSLVWGKMLIVGGILVFLCAGFFRDPERDVPQDASLLVSPADGKVTSITRQEIPQEFGFKTKTATRVSVFLNVFNVHVNRVPAACRVTKRVYVPGKHVNACLDKESADNERLYLGLALNNGVECGLIQIAGLIARRIVCYATEGQSLAAGERYGIIKFGSRVDIYVPDTYEVAVSVGQKVTGGLSIIAREKANSGTKEVVL